jgi:sugar (pentulose or hexulose) kinase
VFEGVALNAGWLIPHVVALAESTDRSISFGGGGARAPLWGQLLADVLGAEVRRLANPHVTNAHGAALLALVEAGSMSWDDADAALCVAEIHHPDPSVSGTYRRLLDAFVDAHDRWSPTFRTLNSRSQEAPT